MKKTILAAGLFIILSSCTYVGHNTNTKDSTSTKIDTLISVKDSTKVDSTKK